MHTKSQIAREIFGFLHTQNYDVSIENNIVYVVAKECYGTETKCYPQQTHLSGKCVVQAWVAH